MDFYVLNYLRKDSMIHKGWAQGVRKLELYNFILISYTLMWPYHITSYSSVSWDERNGESKLVLIWTVREWVTVIHELQQKMPFVTIPALGNLPKTQEAVLLQEQTCQYFDHWWQTSDPPGKHSGCRSGLCWCSPEPRSQALGLCILGPSSWSILTAHVHIFHVKDLTEIRSFLL